MTNHRTDQPMNDFQSLFGRAPAVTAEAPGRVNLIGEHTDYNGGFVLPSPIPQRSRVELAPRSDEVVRVWSANAGAEVVEYRLGAETPGRDWLDYAQGVTRVLRAEGFALRGFDARIVSDVPLGSGLSSSAALDVSLMRALRSAFRLDLDDLRIALLGQRVENQFVGAQVGIMDPMASSLGEEGSALFIDTRSLAYERIPLPPGAELVVVNSGVAHQHAAGDYNTRRAECERACALLGVRQLRDLSVADLSRVNALPEPLNRRARHVVTENERVLATVAAMRAGDLPRIGRLFFASHESQRDDYQVSIPEIDLLVELARGDADVYGARLTGGGFGGSVVMLVRSGAGSGVAQRIARAYAERSGRQPTVLIPAGD
jgi:galactokinase